MTRPSHPLFAVLACLVGFAADPSQAGNLEIYESSVGQGQVRSIPGPVTNVLIDLDYSPATAEGGRLYGVSEIEIEATGNLVLTPTGFACQATSCLYAPAPFVTGKRIRVTAGNDLVGSNAAASNFLRIGVTGSTGHLVLVRGEYLDSTGAAGSVGAIRTVDAAPLVTVPELELAVGLASACALLALAGRRKIRPPAGAAMAPLSRIAHPATRA